MQTLGKIVASSPLSNWKSDPIQLLRSIVEAWLRKKIVGNPRSIEGAHTFRTGNKADVKIESVTAAIGSLVVFRIVENSKDQTLRTSVGFSRGKDAVDFIWLFEGASTTVVLKPIFFDVRIPNILSEIIQLTVGWNVSGYPVPFEAGKFDEDEYDEFVSLINDEKRILPVVVVSELDTLTFYPDAEHLLAKSLMAIAKVVKISQVISRKVTQIYGKEWSVYNGAVKIYWPGKLGVGNFRRNALFTVDNILSHGQNHKEAAQRLGNYIRYLLLSISGRGISTPTSFDEIRDSYFSDSLSALREKVDQQSQDFEYWKSTAHEYDKLNNELQAQVSTLRDRCGRLEIDNENLSAQLSYALRGDEAEGNPTIEKEIIPETVEDVYLAVLDKYSATLWISGDVEGQMSSLNPNAGPPEKILKYFEGLSNLAVELKKGSIGMTAVEWLNHKGLKASIESETVSNSKEEVKRRTFKFPSGDKFYPKHLKPSDGVSPDRCVRIYFEWDENSKKICVGYFGAHF